MSKKDRAVMPEWGIVLRNLVDRIAPVVNEHHQDIDLLKYKVEKLEQTVAQQATIIQKQNQDIAVMRAMTQGVGPTSTGPTS